jgi:hypothetical protein
MLGGFMSVQDVFHETIPSQKCHMNEGLILSGYRYMGILYAAWHKEKLGSWQSTQYSGK